MKVTRMEVQEAPVSPASSSMSNPTTQPEPTNEQQQQQQVLLATMQPVGVLDLHEHHNPTAHISLHPKYHHHHHHHHHVHPKYSHHLHSSANHHHSTNSDANDQVPTDSEDGQAQAERVTPVVVSEHDEETGHKMIDLIYNDGQKTIMYTHDKEIIYENEADRVQVVEYPPPEPSPPSPSSPSRGASAGLLPLNYVAKASSSNGQPTTLHLHYNQLQLASDQDLPRALVNGASVPTTATVLVLSELVDPSGNGVVATAPLTLATAASLRAAG
ncbi:hypothetical protein TKK_0009382 [Trichogramma kaykai]